MSDEPLDEWEARRDASRPAPGARRAVPLGDGTARGAHVGPDTARGMLEWDRHQWVTSGVAVDRTVAVEETGPQNAAERVRLPRSSTLPPAPEPWRRPAPRPYWVRGGYRLEAEDPHRAVRRGSSCSAALASPPGARRLWEARVRCVWGDTPAPPMRRTLRGHRTSSTPSNE
ncbi:DUF6087 family protein [Streptomyces sp. NPDC014735]|uniref:DUF6087 family protein n=1 Tax=unclassified Streptomyces TaxID=2593676 RepID=UPI0036F8BCD8